jgi:predicted glycosyltransferase
LLTIGQPQPLPDFPAAQPVKVIARIKNNNVDIWFLFFIIVYFLLYKKRAVLPVPKKINIKILVAPLDWGLGHATRCIPLIRYLLQSGCNVVIATSGAQEILLKTEFPQLEFVRLAGYNIRYANNKRFFAFKIISQLPKILISIKKEKKWLEHYVLKNRIDIVISDNRYGLYNPGISSVIITHQLVIKAPFKIVEKTMQFFNYRLIEKFNQCWIPDTGGQPNLAGVLSHPARLPAISTSYLGGMSRFQYNTHNRSKFDILVVVSGPEPQRTMLENKLLLQLQEFKGKCLFVRGLPASRKNITTDNNSIIIKNHLESSAMEAAFNESNLVISRSGYTTLMDICKLRKKSILIPTPGQTEQEYLAQHLENQGWCLTTTQDRFDLKEQLKRAENFNYRLPVLNMEVYKTVLDKFLGTITINERDN